MRRFFFFGLSTDSLVDKSDSAQSKTKLLTKLTFFQHFGEITKNQLDKSVPLLVISYATRLNAEQAILRGRTFKDKQLQVRNR